jgi:hypothetical protein
MKECESMPSDIRYRALFVGLCAVLMSVSAVSLRAQDPDLQHRHGQQIFPVYEGWEKNDDGSFNLVFGYFNRNFEEIIDIPIGPENIVEPGPADQGQPTHFYPRRTRFLFRVRVPADFGKKEVVWTMTSNGKTERAYATLRPEYFIDKLVITANTGGAGTTGGGDLALHKNEPPALVVEGEATRTVKASEPVMLVATARDDGIPKVRSMPRSVPGVTSRLAPNSATGLRVSWFVYRSAGEARFEPAQITEWEDSRDGANSPLAPGWQTPPVPEGNRWVAQVTFTRPGTYVLRCQAHDGALPVTKDVTFVVTP